MQEAERLTFGQWVDDFREFKEIYNFETKQLLYKDVEDEIKRIQMTSEPIMSLADL